MKKTPTPQSEYLLGFPANATAGASITDAAPGRNFDVPPISPEPLAPPPTKAPRRWTKKRIAKTIALILLAAALAVGGYIGYKFIRNALKATNGNLLGLLQTTKLNGEDQGRVNILLAGNSSDDPGHGGAQLTDSIILASINTKDNSAFLLSIPRDTWVEVPGYGHQKINAVYPEGGMDLLERVVEEDFGVTIQYHTLVNYSAFKQAVDAVGGITVNIQSVDPRGIYDPNIAFNDGGGVLKLKNGTQTLNGQAALNLARARNDPVPPAYQRKYGSPYGLPNGDFDRAANQRLMLVALKDKAASMSTLTNPVKIGELLDAIGDNVKTNFSTSELRRLAELAGKIPSGNIKSVSLQDASKGINLLANYTSPDGQAALAPAAGLDDFSDIQRYILRLTSSDPIVQEDAQVVVLNGSGTAGLAKSEATALKGKNVNVTSYSNAPPTATGAAYTSSQIIAVTTSAKAATLNLLKGRYSVTGTTAATSTTVLTAGTTATAASLAKQYPGADYIIILGANYGSSSSSSGTSSNR